MSVIIPGYVVFNILLIMVLIMAIANNSRLNKKRGETK